MSRTMPLCRYCKRYKGYIQVAEDYDDIEDTKPVAYCEAYPEGIPLAVYYTSHFYPKPEDNGLQFVLKDSEDLSKFYQTTQEEEDEEYEERAEYYEEASIPDDKWEEYIKKKYGDKWEEHKERIFIIFD